MPEPTRDAVRDAFQGYIEDRLEDLSLPDSTRRSLDRRRRTAPEAYAIEAAYRRGKEQARSRHKRWTLSERRDLEEKTRTLLDWIRATGAPDDVNPFHGANGLPRVSSQAGYAAVYDRLVDAGVAVDSTSRST